MVKSLTSPMLTPALPSFLSHRYDESIQTSWTMPHYLNRLTPDQILARRDKWSMEVSGEEPIPPPMASFREMKLHPSLVECLDRQGIVQPTPIQMQGWSRDESFNRFGGASVVSVRCGRQDSRVSWCPLSPWQQPHRLQLTAPIAITTLQGSRLR